MISLAICQHVMQDIHMETDIKADKKTIDLSAMSRKELEDFATQKSMESEELAAKIRHYEEIIRIANSKKYRGASEKTHPDQLNLGVFNEAELIAEEGVPEESSVDQIAPRKRTKVKGKRTAWVDTLPTETIDYTLTPEEQVCPVCHEPLHGMSKDIRVEIEIIPAQAKVTKHVTHIYSCRNCERNAEAVPIINAVSPPALISGSTASASAVAYIINSKYVMANPLYRLEQDFKKLGVNLSRQTMSNWLIRVSQDYLRPLYDLLHESLVSRDICHIDETTVEVIKEPGRSANQESYMWLYRTAETDKEPIVLFDYQPGRSGDYPKAFMEGFSGYYHTDGYIGYNKMASGKEEKPPPMRVRVSCWSHARRPYDEALRGLKNEQATEITYCEKGLAYCNKLFELERKWKDISPDERLKKRKNEAALIVDEYFDWCKETSKFAISLLAKAVNYSIRREEHLRNYLRDGRLSISNNVAERSIRSFVVGRNNWLFSFTPKGAEASAVIYSIALTAKANRLNQGAYIEYILSKMPSMDMSDKTALETLLPWADSMPGHLRLPEDIRT